MSLAGGVWWRWMAVAAAAAMVVVLRPAEGKPLNGSDYPQERLSVSAYLQERQTILAQEQTKILGQDQALTAQEKEVNKILMEAKNKEMDDGFETLNFLPAKNFLKVIDQMEQSPVYTMIKQMPKGAALHTHESALASSWWVVKELTYMPHLYMCYDDNKNLLFKFFETPDTSCNWQSVNELRANSVDPNYFDEEIFEHLTLLTDNPDEKYPDINAVWSVFQGYFISITNLVMYRPAWEAYLYQGLKEFADDNVLYIEFRGTLPPLYELDGSQLSPEETVKVYNETVQRFLQDNPDRFFGARFIYAPPRGVDNTTMHEYVTLVRKLKKLFPDFVAGFDLVGQEDLGKPLISFVEDLVPLSEDNIKVFYHAGETNWMGMETDENLIDALLLNTSRIGHGYAIVKHPEAKAMAKEKGVPLEVCPVSNQVLKLVDDLRNHPAASLVAEGFPLVISSDDPGAWGAKALSHDFYEAFMALGGAKADLRFLKQLAENSINYSSLDEEDKVDLMVMWVEKWNEFIQKAHTLFITTTTTTTTTGHPHNTTTTQADELVTAKHAAPHPNSFTTTTKPTTVTATKPSAP